jgi:hypothetical protein
MNSPKYSTLFAMAAVPIFVVGLFFVLQMHTDDNATGGLISPGIITPEGQGSEPFSIIPADKGTKIEYRNILFNDSKEDKAYGSAKTPGAPPAGFFHM